MSWLDHCISNVESHDKINSMEILYSCTGSDLFPLSMCVECSSHTANTKPIVSLTQSCLKWSKLSDADIDRYHYNTENYF